MKIKIRSVLDKGSLAKERLVLDVVSNTDIGDYVLLCTRYSGDSVTTEVYETFWFPDKNVSKGDLVIAYTKRGTDREKTLESGTKSHFFYRGLNEPIWNYKNRAATILYAAQWESKGPDEL